MRKALLLVPLCLLVLGCTSLHPLASPLRGQSDLQGRWLAVEGRGSRPSLEITPKTETEWHLLFTEDVDHEPHETSLTFHEGGLLCQKIAGAYGEEEPAYDYSFYRYEMTGPDHFRLYGLRYEAVKTLIDDGTLHGKAWETTWGTNIRLTSPPEELSQVLVTEEVWEPIFEFERIPTEETGLYPLTRAHNG